MKNLAKLVRNIELGIGAFSIIIFFITIVIQVFARYAGIMVIWTGEVSTYSFVWFVFMGAGVMTYENKHFAFASIMNKLSRTKKEILKIIISSIILIFSTAIFYYGIIITNKFWDYRWINLPAIKMGYTWLCVPILGGANILYCFSHIYQHIQNIKKGRVE